MVTAGALVLSTAVVAVIVLASTNDGVDRELDPPSAAATSTPVVEPTPPAAEAGVSARTLALPQPTHYEGGVPRGYPNTVVGAIAAAYGYSRLASGLDLDATLTAIEAMADPEAGWFATERSAMADGLVAQRAGLGLPPVGPAGTVSLTLTPAGYQVLDREAGAGTATVLTLNLVSARATDGTRTTGPVVLEWNLRWDGTRWLVTSRYDRGTHEHLARIPLTTQAEAAGWKAASGG
ncbi:hypothetical protein [Sporichthya brevicatena]|uniref:hypothetical protein n=1 Tax=Sporichthya brevicatena TaxID=171442 RepID=UPI0031DCA08D